MLKILSDITFDNSCGDCKNRRVFGCAAYANIPYEITSGQVSHDTVRSDQQGDFVYEKGNPDEDVYFDSLEDPEDLED